MTKSFKLNIGYGTLPGVTNSTATVIFLHTQNGGRGNNAPPGFDQPGDKGSVSYIRKGDTVRVGRGSGAADSAPFDMPNCRIDNNNDPVTVTVKDQDGNVIGTPISVAASPGGAGTPFALAGVPTEADIHFD